MLSILYTLHVLTLFILE